MIALQDGWRLAVGSLTRFPSGPVQPSPAAARVMVAVAPAAVLPLAIGAAALVRGGELVGLPELAIGMLVVAWLAVGSRAMHLDGLADVADGLGGGWEATRAREILKRGDVGPFGVVTLIVVLCLQAACVGALAQQSGWILVGVAVAASRWLLALACRAGLAAMPGSRLGATLIGTVPRWQMCLWLGLLVLALSAAAFAAGSPLILGLAAGFAAIALAAMLVRRCARVFEGINGDVMGSVIEIGLTAMLVVFACR